MKKRILSFIIPGVVILFGGLALWQQYGGEKTETFKISKQNPEQGEQTVPSDEKNEKREDVSGSSEATQAQDTVPQQEKLVTVHVCGAVVQEGVYSLLEGSRLADAVELAGGFSPEADRVYHNLAKKLVDGQRIYVPTKEETKEESPLWRNEAEGTEFNGGTQIPEKIPKKLNLNTAGKDELMTLPGIGETKAEQILKYRNKVGAFQSVEELTNVSGIGPGLLEQVKELISVE